MDRPAIDRPVPVVTARRPVDPRRAGDRHLLTIVGFGVILPGEIRIYRQLTSAEPDVHPIGAIGMRNARLGGVQGLMQLRIVFVMVKIRF